MQLLYMQLEYVLWIELEIIVLYIGVYIKIIAIRYLFNNISFDDLLAWGGMGDLLEGNVSYVLKAQNSGPASDLSMVRAQIFSGGC
jgi:hypothetical protein